METPAISVDAAKQQALSSTTNARSVDGRSGSRTGPPSAEIEIPLQLVGCDERLPTRRDDVPPRPRRKLTASPATDGQLSTLHEEEFVITSSSSSQSTSPGEDDDDDDDDDDWADCYSHKLGDGTPLDGELADSESASVDGRQLSVESDVEAATGSTVVSAVTAEWTMIGHRTQHHSASGLTARLGNLLNSAVMKAQKQLGRGQHTVYVAWAYIITLHTTSR